MKNKSLFVLILFILGFLTIKGQNIDIQLLDKINTNKELPSDRMWNFLSNSVTPIAVTTPITMFIGGVTNHSKQLQIKAIESGASIFFATAFSYGLKKSIKRTRPYDVYPEIITKKGHETSFSFPSGHTTTAFATATSLSLAFPKWYVILPSYTYASVVAYSRLHLGMHYPSDVLAGIIIAMGTSFLTFKADKWLNKNYFK